MTSHPSPSPATATDCREAATLQQPRQARPEAVPTRLVENKVRNGLETLENFYDADAPRLRPILEGLGFRRGYARALVSGEGERLGVNVMEFGSTRAARDAAPQVGACWDRPEGNFGVPSIAGATGRRCNDAEGRPVQEVVFTRVPLLYRMKLQDTRGARVDRPDR